MSVTDQIREIERLVEADHAEKKDLFASIQRELDELPALIWRARRWSFWTGWACGMVGMEIARWLT